MEIKNSKFDEMIKALKEANIIQKYIDWIENIPNEIFEKFFKNVKYKEIACDLNPEKHRWYKISITVIKIYDRLLGIKHISELYSEMMTVEDCFEKMEFFEIDGIFTKSFKIKGVKNK